MSRFEYFPGTRGVQIIDAASPNETHKRCFFGFSDGKFDFYSAGSKIKKE